MSGGAALIGSEGQVVAMMENKSLLVWGMGEKELFVVMVWCVWCR